MRIPGQFGQDSDFIRTAFQSNSDTDPIQFGQGSGRYSVQFLGTVGTVSEMGRNDTVGVQ